VAKKKATKKAATGDSPAKKAVKKKAAKKKAAASATKKAAATTRKKATAKKETTRKVSDEPAAELVDALQPSAKPVSAKAEPVEFKLSAENDSLIPVVETETQAIGDWLHQHGKRRHPSIFERRWWDDRILSWAMADESVKVQMFRFVDVLPMLKDHQAVSRHLQEYFEEVNDHLPGAVRMVVDERSQQCSPHGRTVYRRQHNGRGARVGDEVAKTGLRVFARPAR
jgi:hypothetical protein